MLQESVVGLDTETRPAFRPGESGADETLKMDRMVSLYLGCPAGFALEYGWGGRAIDDATWQVVYYDSVDSIWGHPQLRTLATDAPPA